MDTHVISNDLSLSCEGLSRPDIFAYDPYDTETIFLVLRKILALPQNGIGLLASVCELLRDLKNFDEFDNAADEWVRALQLCKAELEKSKTESQDLILAGKNASFQLKMLVSKFDQALPKESKQQIKQLRARITLRYLGNRKPIPEKLARWLVQMISGNGKQTSNLKTKLFCNREALSVLRSSYAPESDEAEFLTTIIAAIDAPIVSPPTLSPQQIVPIISTNHTPKKVEGGVDNEAEKQNKKSSQTQEKDVESIDMVGQFLQQTDFARPRDFAGIANAWDYLQPTELESAVGIFVRDLEGQFAQESLVSLLAISTRVRPKEYRSILISESTTNSMWIDLASGHICWKLEAAIDNKRWRKGRRQSNQRATVRVPLPVETSSRLKTLVHRGVSEILCVRRVETIPHQIRLTAFYRTERIKRSSYRIAN